MTVIEANAFRDAEMSAVMVMLRQRVSMPKTFNQDPEFYSFVRSLQAYQETFNAGSDVMLLQPDSQFFQYLRDLNPATDCVSVRS